LAVLVLTLVSGCSSGSAREVHDDGGGPLSANVISGGKALQAPGETPWYASFGGSLLCSREPGSEIELQRVRYDATVEPEDVEVLLRAVPPMDGSMMDERIEWAPLGGVLGRHQDYANGGHRGDFSSRVAGAVVDQSCEDAAQIGAAFTELVLELRVGESGARIPTAYVDYTADGEPHTLRIDRGVVACGGVIRDEVSCQQ